MTLHLFGLTIAIERPRLLVRREPALSERQMNEALASLSETHPVWLTIHQLIDTAEENAWSDAGAEMGNSHLLAGYVGGSRHLDLLRSDLVQRRKLGKKAEIKGGRSE